MPVTTPELAVLVPVLGRPQNVEPLVASFRASGAPGRLVFLASVDDDDEVMAIEGHDRIVDTWQTWPQKIAGAVSKVEAEWFLLAADDISFEPGWWDATERFRSSHVQVIGTNDGANPRSSISGIHTTHPLVHRDFHAMGMAESPVWHEYHHWFVDDELVQTAKARGVWAWCEEARVTHHHPYFDQSVPLDDTYRLGEKHRDEDFALWAERCQLLGLRVA